MIEPIYSGIGSTGLATALDVSLSGLFKLVEQH